MVRLTSANIHPMEEAHSRNENPLKLIDEEDAQSMLKFYMIHAENSVKRFQELSLYKLLASIINHISSGFGYICYPSLIVLLPSFSTCLINPLTTFHSCIFYGTCTVSAFLVAFFPLVPSPPYSPRSSLPRDLENLALMLVD